MSAQIISASYNDAVTINFTNDAWLNATKVAESFGKRVDNWLRLDGTIEYIDALKEFLNTSDVSDLELIKTRRGKYNGGTWLHPKLSIRFAQWLDVRFAVWCDMQIDSILKSQFNSASLPEPPTKKALPGKLTLDHQDTIKALVKERAESLPKNKQAGAAIKCWSAIKNKYGCSYKEIDDENFVNVISLISRLPLEGELLHKEQGALTLTIAPTDEKKQWLASSNNGTVTVKELEANDCIKLLKHHGYIVNHKDHLLNSLSKLIVNVLHPEK